MLLRSDSGRVFEIPEAIVLQYEKFSNTGFLAQKEAKFRVRNEKIPEEVKRARDVNEQFQKWMRTLDATWDVERGGVAITISAYDPDPGMYPETEARLHAEGIKVEREETWERLQNSSARRLVYRFSKL